MTRTTRAQTTNRAPSANREALVYEQIRELIVHGRLAPGTRIIESEVASRLAVSRTPVRSALQRLQQEGYIITTGNGRQARPSVAPLTREDAWELFGVVGGIEGLAGRLAATLPEERKAALVAELEAVNQRLLLAISADNLDRNLLFNLDTEFHHAYVAAAAGPRLRVLHDAIKPQAERYVRLYTSALWDEVSTSVQEHGVIIAAIGAGDEGATQHAVQENWRNAALRLNRVIDTVGERGSW
jgi:DNA-binding GntR family transcriptional regulator